MSEGAGALIPRGGKAIAAEPARSRSFLLALVERGRSAAGFRPTDLWGWSVPRYRNRGGHGWRVFSAMVSERTLTTDCTRAGQ